MTGANKQQKAKSKEELKASRDKAVFKANLRIIAITLGGLVTVGYKAFQHVTASTVPSLDATPSNDNAQCSVDPSEWSNPYHSELAMVTPLSTFDASHNESLFWGHFRPSVYWGLRTRSWPTMAAVGMMWSTPLKESIQSKEGKKRLPAKDRVLIRHDCKEGDGVAPFGFDRHDGRGFASQHLTDTQAGIQFHTLLAKPQLLSQDDKSVTPPPQLGDSSVSLNHFEWVARISGKPIDEKMKSKPLSVLLYAGFDCDGLVDPSQCIRLPAGKQGKKEERRGLQVKLSKSGGVVISPNTDTRAHESTIGAAREAKEQVLKWELNILPAYGTSYSVNPVMEDEEVKTSDKQKFLSRPYFRYQCIDPNTGMSDIASLVSDPLAKVTLRSKKTFVKLEKESFFNNTCSSSASMVAIVVTFSADQPFSIDMNMFNSNHLKSASMFSDEDKMSLDVDAQGEVLERKEEASFDIEKSDELTNNWRRWMDSIFKAYEVKFDERFEKVWQLKAKGFGESHVKAGQFAMSNLLGGVGYFAGKLQLKAPKDMGGSDEQVVDSFAMPLFTGSPSRSFFPRGFAWDEGFHQQLILKWDLKLGSDILSHWLQTLHQQGRSEQEGGGGGADCGGWIPREQALGAEARKRVPSEFFPQDITVANPPTLLLLLDALVKQSTSSNHDNLDELDSETVAWLNNMLIPALFPRAAAWIEWMIKSQLTTRNSQLVISNNNEEDYSGIDYNKEENDSSSPVVFRWRGRDANEGKLMPTTFASGLDDYPRALFPSQNESHVDLLCWITNGVEMLENVANHLLKNTDLEKDEGLKLKYQQSEAKYAKLKAKFTKSLSKYHWSDKFKGYFDTGVSYQMKTHLDNKQRTNANDFVSSIGKDIMVSCGDGKGDNKIVAVPYNYESNSRVKRDDVKKRNGCPSEYPKFNWPLGGSGEGGYLLQNAVIPPKRRDKTNTGDSKLFPVLSNGASYQYVTHVGYITLFPMLLTVLDPHSSNQDEGKLLSLLELLHDDQVLWSPYGVRSLSKQDLFYGQENAPGDAPYWRGAVWMPINFLTLRSLQHYSKHAGLSESTKLTCLAYYEELRLNLMNNLLKHWDEHHSFWEQYDDVSGKGLRSQPFTGWTALILNVMAEQYSL